jgi:hypothetical protein|tara:strand:- start:73 stop:315 length:243 start_codon:yes stop_codon:yes gene_type:complete
MEMLKTKELISGVSIVLVAGSIAWIVSTLIEVDKRTAVTEVKVTENHKMLHTLWVDFIKRKTQNGNLAEFNLKTDNKSTR